MLTKDAVWDTHNVILDRETVLRLAREAVSEKHEREFGVWQSWEELEAFAKLVAEHEREACACECEKDAFVEQWKGLAEATKRIRARGQA